MGGDKGETRWKGDYLEGMGAKVGVSKLVFYAQSASAVISGRPR